MGGRRKGAGRKPTGRTKVAMLVRVSPEVRKRLERDAKRARRSLSSEVELQLNDALRASRLGDPRTRALCYLITTVAELAEPEGFDWRSHRFDFEILKSAIDRLLNVLAPPGAPVRGERWQRTGRWIAADSAVVAGQVGLEKFLDFVTTVTPETSPVKIGEWLATTVLANAMPTFPPIRDILWKEADRVRGSAYYALPQAARDLGLPHDFGLLAGDEK
jgi:hypothetical protein